MQKTQRKCADACFGSTMYLNTPSGRRIHNLCSGQKAICSSCTVSIYYSALGSVQCEAQVRGDKQTNIHMISKFKITNYMEQGN